MPAMRCERRARSARRRRPDRRPRPASRGSAPAAAARASSRLSRKMREIAVRIAGRRDALVDLHDVHAASHGTSSSASARSISHGVWPPLTAMTKRPACRDAPRARRSRSMPRPARRATASASRSIDRSRMVSRRVRPPSTVSAALDDRILPAVVRARRRVDLARAPGARLVLDTPGCPPAAPDRRCATPPRRSPRARTACGRRSSRRPARARRRPSRRRRDGGSRAARPAARSTVVLGVHHRRAERDRDLGADAEPEVVGRRRAGAERSSAAGAAGPGPRCRSPAGTCRRGCRTGTPCQRQESMCELAAPRRSRVFESGATPGSSR